MQAACECTYKEFLNCQPLNFKGTEGAVGLARWFEKMEYVFHISNYTPKCQVKYATRTLQNGALTWWNSYKRTVDTDVAYAMPWKELMKLMTEVYCPRNEIQKMESGLWNLTMKGNDVTAYKQRPQDVIRMASSLIDQKVHANVARQADNKIKWENHSRDNHVHQQPFKRPNVARVYTAKIMRRRPILETFLIATSASCIMLGLRVPLANQKTTVTCSECGRQGHYRSDYPNLRNQNGGNQAGNGKARGRAYALGGGEANRDPNVITITKKKTKDKSEEKRLEDVSIMLDFLKVFPKDLSGLLQARQVEFQINLVPNVTPII
ncbi:putative reverse transcriptase domain-containing protein [Tanacetum coccineum]